MLKDYKGFLELNLRSDLFIDKKILPIFLFLHLLKPF